METTVLIALITATFATTVAAFARSTRQAIFFLSMQAIALGSMELVGTLFTLLVELHFEALVQFSITFSEWFSCAIVIPLIIYWGVMKTENVVDRPVIGVRGAAVVIIATVVPYMILHTSPLFSFPSDLDVLPFSMLMFSLSVFLMATRNDPLKILIGLNMAENALYPLFSKSPLLLIPLILVLMIFVTVAGVFIVKEAYSDYGTLSISKWRWTD